MDSARLSRNGTQLAQPSPWVVRWSPAIPARGRVLDLAAGSGRHARWLTARGYRVLAVDRDADALAGLTREGIEVLQADLEQGPWPLPDAHFDGIVVTCYLHRPLFPLLEAALAPGGVLIYETFMVGQQDFGRPTRPDFLLRPNELLGAFPGLVVLAFAQGYSQAPRPAMMQRITAYRP